MALGTDNLKETFATVLGIMDHRLMDLPALMMLRGRVDLISNQFTMKKGNVGEEDIDATQLLKYEDENGEYMVSYSNHKKTGYNSVK